MARKDYLYKICEKGSLYQLLIGPDEVRTLWKRCPSLYEVNEPLNQQGFLKRGDLLVFLRCGVGTGGRVYVLTRFGPGWVSDTSIVKKVC